VAGHKINQMMVIEARARMAIEVVQSLEARVKNSAGTKKDTHFISECYKLKNKEKRTGTYRPKGHFDEGNDSVAATTDR
jgi:hypothetical protein